MTRLAVILLPITVLLAGCAGPIETRVQTVSSAPNSQLTTYSFSDEAAPNLTVSELVQRQLRQELKARGYQEAQQAPVLLNFSVADRPAFVGVQFGEDDKAHTDADAKEKKPFQSCKDREHRLIVTLIDRKSGNRLYRGTASEYHCKAKLKQSVPHLVTAAFSDLGGNSSSDGTKILVRRGLE